MTIIFFFLLSGLAETYLHLEKEKLKIVFDGKAIECAQYVVHYISRWIIIFVLTLNFLFKNIKLFYQEFLIQYFWNLKSCWLWFIAFVWLLFWSYMALVTKNFDGLIFYSSDLSFYHNTTKFQNYSTVETRSYHSSSIRELY